MRVDEHLAALGTLGFTARQTRFLATVALHGGYCLRRQFTAFAGIKHGKNIRAFFEELVRRRLVETTQPRADRGRVYHVTSRSLYGLLGQDEGRHRRVASAALIARRIMILDHVLDRPAVDWLATGADKVQYFRQLGVQDDVLPSQRVGASKRTPSAQRYFLDRLPIAAGDAPVFVYLALDLTGKGLRQFLEGHAALLARLSAWTVRVVGVHGASLAAAQAAFARRQQPTVLSAPATTDELAWLLETRQRLVGDLTSVSVASIHRYRALRDTLGESTIERLAADWQRHGSAAIEAFITSSRHRVPLVNGRLEVELLNHDYSLFGSLPGVA